MINGVGSVRIGPAGWSYADWKGVVYPASGASGSELEYIAKLFDVVEINTSFYRPVRKQTARVWIERSRHNSRFRFTAKLYRRFTHERDASEADERLFKEGLEPLMEAGSLGALLLQFPWSFKNVSENRAYLRVLLRQFHAYPLVVEVRHLSWNREDALAFLTENGAGFCNLDQPVIGRSLPPTAYATSALGYVRLHGRNYKNWFSESDEAHVRYDYLYDRRELEEWKERIESISSRTGTTYVIFNNHFEGKSVANAIQLRSLLEGKRIPAPEHLRSHYWQLEDSTVPFVGPEERFRLE